LEKVGKEDLRQRGREKALGGKADTRIRVVEKVARGKDTRGRATAAGRWGTRRRNVGVKA